MKLFDVTLTLSPELPSWPGDAAFQLIDEARIEDGEICNVSSLRLSSHAGTHIDAPRHFVADGVPIDQLPLETLVGDAWVCRLPGIVQLVTAAELEAAGIPEGARRLLLATSNSALWGRLPHGFTGDYVALSGDAASWLVNRGVVLVGVDYLSVDPAESTEYPAHRTLLGNGVVIVEGLDLRAVPQGSYQLFCLPLKVQDADGAPARVVLASNTEVGSERP